MGQAENLLGDGVELDFPGSGADGGGPRPQEAEQPAGPLHRLRRGLPEQARRAEHVDRELVDVLLERGDQQSRDRRRGAGLARGEDVADGALGVVADDADPDFQVHQAVTDQRVGELAAFAGELFELGQHATVHRRLVQGAGRPLVPEAGAGQPPAVVLRADPVDGRHPHVIEEHLGEQVPAGEVAQRPDLDSRRMRVDDQIGDALLPAFPGSGPDQGEEDVCVGCVRRPDLLAVDDVLVAVAAGGGAQAGQVRACFRFRVALGPDRVAAQHRG
jgi:hypothetical protein